MSMRLPVFFLFSIYGVINTYLPIILRNMGYSITNVGVLLAIFEIAGLTVPFAISLAVDKNGNYGKVAVFYGILLILLPIPLMFSTGFWFTALFLALFSLGFKGAVPLSDSHISYLLGANAGHYGRVRAIGSTGFVVMTLTLQFFGKLDSASRLGTALWLIIPALLYTFTMVTIPGLLSPCRADEMQQKTDNKKLDEQIDNKKQLAWHKKISTHFEEFPRIFWVGMGLVFLVFFGLVPASRFLPLYVVDVLHIKNFAVLWAISAASEIPFMFFAYRFLRRFDTLNLLLFCTGAVSVRTLLYIIFPSFTGAVIGQLCNTITYGIFHPAAVLFVSQYAPKKYLVFGMTLYSLVTAGLGTVCGSLAGGLIIDKFGYTALFISFAAVPVMGLGVFFYFRNKK